MNNQIEKQARDLNICFSKEDIQITKRHMKMLNTTNYQRNTNQKYNEVSPYISRNNHNQKSTNSKYGRGCGEKGALLFGGNVNWCIHYGKLYGVSLKSKKQSYHMIQQPNLQVQIRENHNSKRYQEFQYSCSIIYIYNTQNMAAIHQQMK